MIFIPPDTHSSLYTNDSLMESVSINNAMVEKMLSETWALTGTPIFEEAYEETVDSCFQIIASELERNVFKNGRGNSEQTTGLSTPPLASVLPQINAIAKRLLAMSIGQQPHVRICILHFFIH